MDKDKLRTLIIRTWKDGNSQFHDQKGSVDYDADLEVWFDTIEDDIKELCGGECSNEDSGLHLQRVSNNAVAVAEPDADLIYQKAHELDEKDFEKWMFDFGN